MNYNFEVCSPRGGFAERFEDLIVWQNARVLVKQVYTSFAPVRDYSFKDQIQRASLSVMNNIAEGFERRTPKDFAHFLDLAKGSCGEVRSMLYVAEDLQFLQPDQATKLRDDSLRISKAIAAFTTRLRAKS